MIKGYNRVEKNAFHIKHINGHYHLFTPLNEPFLSLGINHAGAIAEPDPFNLFQSKYKGDWKTFSQTVVENFRNWGFNTAGYHSPFELHKKLPFMAEAYPYPAGIAYWMPEADYPDVFDPKWEAEINNTLKLMYELVKKNNKNIIGYYWTDTPRWNLDLARQQIGKDWVTHIRSLPESAPGKKQYLKFLMDRYADNPSVLGSAYNLQTVKTGASIDKILSGICLDLPTVREDDRDFLRLIARRYYGVLGECTRSIDPDHLIFGDRYLGGDHPKEVIEEALPWTDVLSVQPLGIHFEEDLFDSLFEMSQKPILICDHQSSFYSKEYPETLWSQLPSEAEAAKAYHDYLTTAFKKPYIIGYHRCQYIDRFDKNSKLLKQGLLREDETPYQLLVEQVKRTNHFIKNIAAPYQYENERGKK